MQGFVHHGGRAGSSQQPRSRIANRQQIAANAKVPVKRTILGNEDAVHKELMRPQSGSHDPLASQQQLTLQHGHGGQVRHNPWDTDAESLDTTLPGGSLIKVEDSQNVEPGFGQQPDNGEHDYQDGEDAEGTDGDEEGSEPLYWTEEEGRVLEQRGLNMASFEEQHAALLKSGYRPSLQLDNHVEGDSYPTTTSGVPSDFPQGDDAEAPESNHFDEDPHVSPSPQRLTVKTKPGTQPAGPSSNRAENAAHPTYPIQHQANLFHQSAALRGQNRSGANITARSGQVHQPHATNLQSSQPPTYSQSIGEPDPAPIHNANLRQVHNPQGLQALPQRGAGTRSTSGTSRFHAAKLPDSSLSGMQDTPAKQPVQGKAPAKAAVMMKPPTPQAVEEGSSIHGIEATPIEDYDRPALFKMSYSELRDEDFDTVPRADPPVLSGDMLQKPLTERLEHVQKSFDAVDQGRFFSSLSTTEWEDTGDWFLDQFSSIIKKTKEARQEKRKAAMAFEDEVEKRHRYVAKKQHQVTVSLEKMKTHGQGLIPKSPGRASKSPAKRE